MKHKEIQKEMQGALKSKEEVKLSVLRCLLSAFTNELVAKGKKPQDILENEEVLKVIQKEANKRKDSIEQFTKGNRPELADLEKKELEILEKYLPEQMSDEEIKSVVENKKAELGIEDKSKMGILIGAVMKEVQGRADGSKVKSVVESLLN
ncbi:MAG: GatB/YqeY domain-containing protein [Candidatus Pacebacteria bacterium]|nr:GatB/YqeY domain-containing protein [Candidatus Paceibacterota bacterium]